MDSKSAVCIDNNVKDTKNTRHIYRKVHFVSKDEKQKNKKIKWCEGGIYLSDIATKNVSENDLNNIMKYIMVGLDKW